MQRHSKILQTKVNAKAVVTALICVVFLVIGSVVSAFAIQPPTLGNVSSTSFSFSSGIDSSSADMIFDLVNLQRSMGSFSSAIPLLCVLNSYNQVELYVSFVHFSSEYISLEYVSIDSGTVDVVNPASARPFYILTSSGFSMANGVAYPVTMEAFSAVKVLAYRDSNGDWIKNSGFTFGSAGSNVSTPYQSWKTYYDKVINYDTNIQNATNAGFAQGQLVGRVEGREEGYETGYDEGYDDGYGGGYEEGSNVGYQNGLTQGREEGYETGYDEGEQYGYEVGYREGQDYTYPIAYQEGYDDGYEQGASIGGAPSVSYELDVGSIISALPQAARNIIDGALGFEIFGINVAGTLTAILVVAIVGFVVKWLLSLKS